VALGVCAGFGCTHDEPADPEPPVLAPVDRVATPEDPIEPIPLDLHFDPAKVALGRALFADPILSPAGDVACTTCHDFSKGGADGRPRSDLGGHPPAMVNTPTIFNAALNYRYHWSGRFDDLERQLDIPITSPRVLATTFDAIVEKLQRTSDYPARFAAIYPEGITEQTFRDAMAEYERSLVTPNSRFDRYLRGDKAALSDDERAGYALFKSHGCISCHQGVNVGGNLFQKFGAMRDYFQDRGHVQEADYGRYNVTKREEDRYKFRVASLRNVALTAPYFHDGTAKTLEEAVQIMSKYQLGRKLSPEQTRLLVAFLKTLTGELDGKALE
jgi:cytochrome c peroxidase